MKGNLIMTNASDSRHTPGAWVIDEDGFIQGVNEYGGCGSHQVDWLNDADKAARSQ